MVGASTSEAVGARINAGALWETVLIAFESSFTISTPFSFTKNRWHSRIPCCGQGIATLSATTTCSEHTAQLLTADLQVKQTTFLFSGLEPVYTTDSIGVA